MDNLAAFDSPQIRALVDKYSPFLLEAKKRAIRTLLFFVAATVLGFVFYEKIIAFLIGLLSLKNVNIVFTSPFQFINLAITCGVATGVVLTLPLLIYQLLSFLKPALRRKEFKTIIRLLPFSMILFAVGFTLGAIVMKWQIEIFLSRSLAMGIGNVLDVSSLLNTIILTSVLMGVGFQFPILLLLFLRIGLIKRQMVISQRKWIYLASVIFAILLPADTIIADILLSLPLILMFEITILLDRLSRRDS